MTVAQECNCERDRLWFQFPRKKIKYSIILISSDLQGSSVSRNRSPMVPYQFQNYGYIKIDKFKHTLLLVVVIM